MQRKYLIAANWKMNPAPQGAYEGGSPYMPRDDVDVAVFPTILDACKCLEAGIRTGSQHGALHPDGYGAHTGDVSMQMLKDSGCEFVLCGHSERRQYHGESDQDVANQVGVALEVGLRPVICMGETEQERELGQEKNIIQAQMSILPLNMDLTFAYEPVWAIGTGNTATPEQAQEMHAFIRSLLPDDKKGTAQILYGGSMKPENAEELLQQPDIDGGLIGGASLKPDQFAAIVETAATMKN